MCPKKSVYWGKAGNTRPKYDVGMLVLRRIPFYKPGEGGKLAPKFDGPYKIDTCDAGGVTFRLRRVVDGKIVWKVHVSQIKKYHGHETEVKPRITLETRSPPLAVPKRIIEPSYPDPCANIEWSRLTLIPFRILEEPAVVTCSPVRDPDTLVVSHSSTVEEVSAPLLESGSSDQVEETFSDSLTPTGENGDVSTLVSNQDSLEVPTPESGEVSDDVFSPAQASTPAEAERALPRRSARIKRVTQYFGFSRREK